MIRDVKISDAKAICDIYNHYIANTIVTFEEELVDISAMIKRITHVSSQYPWIVYEVNGEILGYAYANKWKSRTAYRLNAETTVYIKPKEEGQGIGNKLYLKLIALLKETELHTLIGGISLPNSSSIALHEKHGFKKVAHFEQVGKKLSQWVDVGYWQLKL